MCNPYNCAIFIILYGYSHSEHLLHENSIRYVADDIYYTRLMLMMIPFWVLSVWLTIYGLNVILYIVLHDI